MANRESPSVAAISRALAKWHRSGTSVGHLLMRLSHIVFRRITSLRPPARCVQILGLSLQHLFRPETLRPGGALITANCYCANDPESQGIYECFGKTTE